MLIAVTDAKAQLLDLVRRVEAGEDVILTRHGTPVVRLTPVHQHIGAAQRRAAFKEFFGKVADDGISAARSQDFLYDDQGLPD